MIKLVECAKSVFTLDGYIMQAGTKKFTTESLAAIKILAIENALADTGDGKLPAKSAFTKDEINALNNWVLQGGSLLLISDHIPFQEQPLNLHFRWDLILLMDLL